MFNVQKCFETQEIYVYYNEYLAEDEDESIPVLEHIFAEDDIKEFRGTIDLITVKNLSQKDEKKIKEIHDKLKSGEVLNLYVISDNKRVLKRVKEIMPDVSTKLLKIS